MDAKERLALGAIGLSVISIVLAFSTFFRTFLYSNHSLEATPTSVRYVDNKVIVECLLSNPGNTDAVLLDTSIAYWRPKSWGSLVAGDNQFKPVIVPPGHVQLVSIPSAGTDAGLFYNSAFAGPSSNPRNKDATRKEVLVGLRFTTMSASGVRHSGNFVAGSFALARDSSGKIVSAGWGLPMQTLQILDNLTEFPPLDSDAPSPR
jgi:hypothetical protein